MSNIDKQALRKRYSEKPAPKCHICGSVMTIQRAGAGGVVYGCTGRIDKDGEGYKFAEGRDFADDHYARSRVTVANESDPDVLALLDELESAESLAKQQGNIAVALFDEVTTLRRNADDKAPELRSQLEEAEKRIAELSGEFFALPPLNDELIAILGRPNFTCAHLAELLRKGGQDIRRKAEHEQAAVIYWFLDLYLKYGEKWEGILKDDIQARVAMITAAAGKGE